MTVDILQLLSQPRLEAYRYTFKPVNDSELLGAYLWGQAVSASLHPLLGLSEVVLRNAIHRSLSLQCSRQASGSFRWYDRVERDSIALKGKSLAKIEELLCGGRERRRKQVQPTPDLVVSRLSFGFWPNVMEELSNRYAPRTFTDVFSAHPHTKPKYWNVEANKANVVLRLKRFQDMRNRVCHFEAVWKPHWVNAQGTHWSYSVKGLRDLHDSMVELLGWSSEDAVSHYKSSFGYNWFSQLCTTHAVRAFMHDPRGCARLSPLSS